MPKPSRPNHARPSRNPTKVASGEPPPNLATPEFQTPWHKDDRVFAIHYSCALPESGAAEPPEVSAIVVQHVRTRQQFPFASVGAVPPDQRAEAERKLLGDFFEFAAARPTAIWLNWGMRGPRFGFEVLSSRAKLLGLTVGEIPINQRFNLDAHLTAELGPSYLPDPRFIEAIRRNGCDQPELLDAAQSAQAWREGRTRSLFNSLACKVNAIANLFTLVGLGEFTVRQPAESPNGEALSGFQGGSALAEALGVGPGRRKAFEMKLTRERDGGRIPDADWKSVDNPTVNEPRYWYRVDSQIVRMIATQYQ